MTGRAAVLQTWPVGKIKVMARDSINEVNAGVASDGKFYRVGEVATVELSDKMEWRLHAMSPSPVIGGYLWLGHLYLQLEQELVNGATSVNDAPTPRPIMKSRPVSLADKRRADAIRRKIVRLAAAYQYDPRPTEPHGRLSRRTRKLIAKYEKGRAQMARLADQANRLDPP
jgi:hypothetical protein